MRVLCVLMALLTVGLVGCVHRPGVKLGKVTKVEAFTEKNRDGLRLELVHLEGAQGTEGPSGLVRFINGQGAFDGHVFPFTTHHNGDWMGFLIRWNGRDWTAFETVRGRHATYDLARGELALVAVANPAIDANELIERYQREEGDGTLARLAAFDRAGEVAEERAAIDEGRAAAQKACGVELAADVDWAKLSDDELIQGINVGASCGEVLKEIAAVCAVPVGREVLLSLVKRVECLPGDPAATYTQFQVEAGVLRVAVNRGANFNLSTATFLQGLGASASASSTPFPWRDGSSIADRMVLDSMATCRDERGHLVVVGPLRNALGTLAVDTPPGSLLVGTSRGVVNVSLNVSYPGRLVYEREPVWFIDGRHRGPTPETRARSSVVVDSQARTCTVTCGTRAVVVPLVPTEEARALLKGLTLLPAPFTRRPHALLRDNRGTYYFVDTGAEPERARDFRVFVGPRGQLKQQKMTNSLSDSEGEIFSTKTGDLRLVLDRLKPSFWTAGAARTELRAVPVDENLDVIFAELGVYAGLPLGTPCDDF